MAANMMRRGQTTSLATRSRRGVIYDLLPLFLIVAAFASLSALWALRIPIPTFPPNQWSHYNPDEWNHVAVIAYMATHRKLPPYSIDYPTTIHPPAYHALGAVVYAAALPLIGRDGAVLLLRLLSGVMGAGVVWLVYRAARRLMSHPAALLAAGVVAGVPMFVSLSAAVTNENLSTLAAAGALYTIVAGLSGGFDTRRVAALSVWASVGLTAKVTCLGLLPAAFFALWWAGRKRGLPVAAITRQMSTVLIVCALASGWWFVRNHILYGDPLRAAVSIRLWHPVHPSYADYAARYGTPAWQHAAYIAAWAWTSFWGFFDALRCPLPIPLYLLLACVEAAVGIGLLRIWRAGQVQGHRAAFVWVVALLAAFVTAVFYQFNWQLFTPQGRYFFPLLLPFGVLMAAGWRALFPSRLRGVASAALLSGLLLLNLYTLAALSTRLRPFP
jgi:hypothetical protein